MNVFISDSNSKILYSMHLQCLRLILRYKIVAEMCFHLLAKGGIVQSLSK